MAKLAIKTIWITARAQKEIGCRLPELLDHHRNLRGWEMGAEYTTANEYYAKKNGLGLIWSRVGKVYCHTTIGADGTIGPTKVHVLGDGA